MAAVRAGNSGPLNLSLMVQSLQRKRGQEDQQHDHQLELDKSPRYLSVSDVGENGGVLVDVEAAANSDVAEEETVPATARHPGEQQQLLRDRALADIRQGIRFLVKQQQMQLQQQSAGRATGPTLFCSGFSPFLFANQAATTEPGAAPPPAAAGQQLFDPRARRAAARPPTDTSAALVSSALRPQLRVGGGGGGGFSASRSLELPADATINGVSVAFAYSAGGHLSVEAASRQGKGSRPQLQQQVSASGTTRTRDLLMSGLDRADAANSDALSDSAASYPPISESQMMGSSSSHLQLLQDAEAGGSRQQPQAATQQHRQIRRESNANAQQQLQGRGIKNAAQSRPMEELVEKFTFSDPSTGTCPGSFLQRLGEIGVLEAETIRHEKMKASKRKLRS